MAPATRLALRLGPPLVVAFVTTYLGFHWITDTVAGLVAGLLLSLLFWVAPNVRQPRFRWLTVGSGVALLAWVVLSAGFGFYVANFGSYNKTYGSLAAVIIFLIWLWITNVVILLGAEMNAEIERGRQIEQGHPPDEEPF